GGKVVKNVTGYDLPKLMAGSFGTLALMTEITIKVVPAPETTLTLVIPGLDVVAANRVMTAALASTADPSGAAFLPAALAHGLVAGLEANRSATLLRLEGSTASVAYRRQALEALVACPATVLGQDKSTELWRTLGRLRPLAETPSRAIWLLSVPPASGGAVVETLARIMADMNYFLDWGGGRIWLSVPVETVGAAAQAANIRAALSLGGHASLLRAPDNCRRGDDVFSAEAPLDLLRGIRTAFDPKGLFNRGRLHSGL
ncbi:MAG: 2-hydroxy-acid oxidase, partial [Rhodospirillaceae bacterium]|nr:2-hydroxy-acid oxidase [Rhodospirillaceae bacterium]